MKNRFEAEEQKDATKVTNALCNEILDIFEFAQTEEQLQRGWELFDWLIQLQNAHQSTHGKH